MAEELLAAIDQGTTGSRCILFTPRGEVRASAYEEHSQIYPQPGWVEHDAAEIWTKTARVTAAALAQAGALAADIAGLGITNQRETVVVWDAETGRPLAPAIVWQDTRTREHVARLVAEGLEPMLRERTGLVAATYFSGPKLAWLLQQVPGLRARAEAGKALCGTMDSWLIWNLTGGPEGGAHVTDITNASRTLLMNLRTLEWDDDLLHLFGIPRAMLPQIRPSSDLRAYGVTRTDGPLNGVVSVCGAAGDQQAALVGQTCFAPGETKNTYGTGCFLLLNTGREPVPSQRGLLTTVAYATEAGRCTYALEGSIAITGAAVQWLRDNLGLIRTAAETEEIAAGVEDAGGVYFVPAFSGLFAPHWDMYARGAIVGLTRFATKAHLVRATLEAICYQTREVLEAMEADTGLGLRALKVDGGAAANNLLMQLQADILGAQVIRPTVRETTALGAAYLAGLAKGVYGSLEDLRANWQVERIFTPGWDEARRAAGYRGWQRAVERARDWVER